MKITILAVGNLKENYLKDAVKEYEKRLSKFCDLTLIEIKESDKKKETENIIKHFKKDAEVIIFSINSKIVSSEDYAEIISKNKNFKSGKLILVIGGSNGLDESALEKKHQLISFGKVTFPHQLFRVVVYEQTYRAFKIINNEKYHK